MSDPEHLAPSSGLRLRPGRESLVIGTRKSPLAVAQAEQVRQWILAAVPGLSVSLLRVTTTGDAFLDRPLSALGGKGLFTKELDVAMQEGRIDLAVHSMKDVPTLLPPGLVVTCLPAREDPRDVLMLRETLRQASSIHGPDDLPRGARIGTVSLRRAAILRHRRPDLSVVMFRGNVGTRLARLDAGEAEATCLALAGLNRLGLRPEGMIPMDPGIMLPAVGQGAIGIQCREDDDDLRALLAPLDHPPTQHAVTAERAFLARLDGSCRTPIAGLATCTGARGLRIEGAVLTPDGATRLDSTMEGTVDEAETLGLACAEAILSRADPALLAALKV